MYYTASIQYNLGLEIISNLVYIFIFASFGYKLANTRHSQITSKLSSLIAPIPTRVKRTSVATPLSLAGGLEMFQELSLLQDLQRVSLTP